jgi:hypothetical protein
LRNQQRGHRPDLDLGRGQAGLALNRSFPLPRTRGLISEHREISTSTGILSDSKVAHILAKIKSYQHNYIASNHLVVGAQGFEQGINPIAASGNIELYGCLRGTYDRRVEQRNCKQAAISGAIWPTFWPGGVATNFDTETRTPCP